MNTSQFMDKQIMDLSSSSPPASTDFIDLTNNNNTINSQDDDHQKQIGDENGLESKKEPIVASYDFQPIRPYTSGGLSHSALDLAGSTTTARIWGDSDSKPISNSSNRVFGSLNSIEPAKLVPEKTQNVLNTAMIISEIDKTMKKHADTLLHVMESVSTRLTQLETKTHNLEDLVDDLKISVENNHGSNYGKLRKLENILLEMRNGVLHLKDKQEILDAQLQLSKLQGSKSDQNPKTNSLHIDPIAKPHVSSVPLPQMPQFPITSFPQPPPSSQLLAQFSPQLEPYSHSQPPPPNHRPYQPPPQQPQFPQQPSGYNNPDEQPPYPPRQQQPPLTGSAPPSQQFYNAPQPQPSMYDRSNSGYLSEPYSYTGSPKPPHSTIGTGGYPQVLNSRPLPHALPTATAVNNSGSISPGSEGRVPVDDVIDRVTTMGFSRDQVKATVRRLTENGQAVDLNVVLDKLMNPGGGSGGGAPREGWYGGQPF